jgi:predicted aldo/keto reductase-like oxidoreductase
MYCNHCLPCPAGIDIAYVNRYLDAGRQQGATGTIRAHYEALAAHAGDCVSCGACEGRCPFGVPVRERMAEAKALFGQ